MNDCEVIQIFINGVYKFDWENYRNKPESYVLIDNIVYKVLDRHFFGDVFRIFLTDKI